MKLMINRRPFKVEGDLSRFLLWFLRDELGKTGTKFGCGAGICGSCTVLVDGKATRSCVTSLADLEGKSIVTIEDLGKPMHGGLVQLHPVQKAFVEMQTPQCGWCMSGQIMTALAFLKENPRPTEKDIVEAMKENYCRCGTYVRIKKAVARAAELMRKEEE